MQAEVAEVAEVVEVEVYVSKLIFLWKTRATLASTRFDPLYLQLA